MAYSNGKITYPVSVQDVQSALGCGSGDMGTLCTQATINMWAKYKPVRKNIINTTGQLNSDKTWKPISTLGNNAWFKGANNDFGITPCYVAYSGTDNERMTDALRGLVAYVNGGLNGWTYTKPNGGRTAPYRRNDFNGYNARAPKPVNTISSIDSEIFAVAATGGNTGSAWEYEYQIMGSAEFDTVPNIDTRDYLMANDIIGTCYVGLAIFKKENNTYIPMAWATGYAWSGLGLGDGSRNIYEAYVKANLAKDTTYYALPVFFSEELPQEQTLPSGVAPYPSWSMQPSTLGRVWTIPYTTFLPFVLREAQTKQNIGFPSIGNRKILPPVGSSNVGSFATKVYVDSSYSSYYEGGTIETLYVGVVNELWDGVWNVGHTTNAHIAKKTSIIVGSSEKKQVYCWGSGGDDTALSLDLSRTWKVVISVNGDVKEVALMPTYDPNYN